MKPVPLVFGTHAAILLDVEHDGCIPEADLLLPPVRFQSKRKRKMRIMQMHLTRRVKEKDFKKRLEKTKRMTDEMP